MGNSFGQLFRVTTWGESHGGASARSSTAARRGCRCREADIQPDLDRRRPGQSLVTSQRKESDTVRILSGVFEGQTLGHADRARDPERGHAARATTARCRRSTGRATPTTPTRPSTASATGGAAAARARARRSGASRRAPSRASCSHVRWGVEIVAWVAQVGRLAAECDVERVTREEVERTPIRCPDPAAAERMIAAVEAARKDGNSLGGARDLRRARLPAGLGRAGLRPAGGGPGQGDAEPAREQGLRDRLGLRRAPSSPGASTTTRSTWTATASARAPTAAAACRAASPTARRSTSASPSSRRRRSCASSRPWTSTTRTRRSRRAAATTRACCPAPCRWWRR